MKLARFDYVLMFCLLALTSCVNFPDSGRTLAVVEPAFPRPVFLALYHPYVSFSSSLPASISPLPSYSGWPFSRMERDLGRMRACGFDGVLLSVAPSDLANVSVIEALSRFMTLSAQQTPVFQVGLLLSPTSPMTLREENVTAYLQKHGLLHSPAMLRLDSKPFLGFTGQVSLQAAANSVCSVRQLGQDWPELPAVRADMAPSVGNEGVLWVQVAGHGQMAGGDGNDDGNDKVWDDLRQWVWPRAGGKHFASVLQQSWAAQPKIVLVSSWNNYLDGSFMEPNTLDQDTMGTIMQRELRQAGF